MRTLLLLLIGLSVLLSGCVTTEISPTDRGVAPLMKVIRTPSENRADMVRFLVFVGLWIAVTAMILVAVQ